MTIREVPDWGFRSAAGCARIGAMIREIRLFVFAIALPALLFAAIGVRSVAVEMARLQAVDRDALAGQARSLANSFRDRACERARRLLGALADDPGASRAEVASALRALRQSRDDVLEARLLGADAPDLPPPDAPPPRPRRGPDGPKGPPPGEWPDPDVGVHAVLELASGARCMVWLSESLVPELAAGLPGAANAPAGRIAAWEIRDGRGEVAATGGGYPAAPDSVAEVPLAPALAEGVLHAAWPDGGAALRREVRRLALAGGCLLAMLACSLVAGGWRLLRALRRERRDARGKADFFDNVSHELKTPLAGIRLNAELLARGRIPDETQRRGAMEAILVESDRLGRMVEELLLFGRLGKGTHRYRLETFDLAAFAREPAEVQGAAGASQGRAQVRTLGPGALVVADKDAVRQIGVAIASNAVKYAGAGPLEIEVEGAEVRYMDRGPGIPRGDEEKVFARGWRADDSLAAATAGSGLGLAIARALARGMGGDLAYRHRPGGGSVFVLTLRRAPRADPPEPPKT